MPKLARISHAPLRCIRRASHVITLRDKGQSVLGVQRLSSPPLRFVLIPKSTTYPHHSLRQWKHLYYLATFSLAINWKYKSHSALPEADQSIAWRWRVTAKGDRGPGWAATLTIVWERRQGNQIQELLVVIKTKEDVNLEPGQC